eukprot:scaffold147163_cov18-Prasinocladus_malaysianus.AAC.1
MAITRSQHRSSRLAPTLIGSIYSCPTRQDGKDSQHLAGWHVSMEIVGNNSPTMTTSGTTTPRTAPCYRFGKFVYGQLAR